MIVGLGCETCQASQVADLARALAPGRLMESFYIQDAGGSIKAIARGVELGKSMLSAIAAQRREPMPLSELIVATECGGLDHSSLHSANPTVGAVSDHVLGAGGTVLLSETPELLGAREALLTRAASPEVARGLTALLDGAAREVAHARRKGEQDPAGMEDLFASSPDRPETGAVAAAASPAPARPAAPPSPG